MTAEVVTGGVLARQRGYWAPLFQMLQGARDYSGIPDVRTLTLDEIDTFYRALVPELLRATKRG